MVNVARQLPVISNPEDVSGQRPMKVLSKSTQILMHTALLALLFCLAACSGSKKTNQQESRLGPGGPDDSKEKLLENPDDENKATALRQLEDEQEEIEGRDMPPEDGDVETACFNGSQAACDHLGH